jgi:type II secretion system protein I
MVHQLSISRARRRGAIAGFTLIELLVSLVILSTGIVVVLEAFQTALSAVGESRDALLADILLRERLAAIETQVRGGSVPAGASGSFPGAMRRFKWIQSVDASPALPAVLSGTELSQRVSVRATVWQRERGTEYSAEALYVLPPEDDGK